MNDRWITQTKFYDPSQPPEVCTGNCTEAALASLFGIRLDEVPSMQSLAGSDYWEALEAFVRSRGFALSMHAPSHCPAGLYLADGPSERGCGHFVVMRDGKMVHDPHPSRTGLLEIEHVWSLAALDPAALSAQPSPRGQDMVSAFESHFGIRSDDPEVERDVEIWESAWKTALAGRQPYKQQDSVALGEATEFCIEKGDRKPVHGSGTLVDSGALQMALNVLRRAGKDEVADALESTAARQPVGKEPVAWRYHAEGDKTKWYYSDSESLLGLYQPLYAAPPAQAVDLSGVREAVRKAWQKCAAGESVDLQFGTLLALIDSQAVGNG